MAADRIIKLAILAVGGQGGGVLANWIENLARNAGYACQATSVAGVAQRTGATIYYIEMATRNTPDESLPVFALAPSAGDVDILIAAELMEAGRAIMRGFVTPDRTTLIASTHRALAVAEKSAPGDGIADSDAVIAAAHDAAMRLILADMEDAALQARSVISASLFGALAGSGVLPFARAEFETAIRTSGKGVDSSLLAFANGHEAALQAVMSLASPANATSATSGKTDPAEQPGTDEAARAGGPSRTGRTSVADARARVRVPGGPVPGPVQRAIQGPVQGPVDQLAAWAQLVQRVDRMPAVVRDMTLSGLVKVVDFQNTAYGLTYLQRVEAVLERDGQQHGYQASVAAAKYIANAMAYDDIIRVADLKTRASRFARIRREMVSVDDPLLQLTEFLHPRAEEIVGMLPDRLGRWFEAEPARMSRVARWFGKGRRLRSDRVSGFTMLYIIGGLRGWRLRTHRHAVESAHLERWLAAVHSHLPDRYGMAVEILKCRRLIKGYSDTHSRALSKFDRVMRGAVQVMEREDGPQRVADLREAALQDEEGTALDVALQVLVTSH